MPSRVIVTAILALGLLAPAVVCARFSDPTSEVAVHASETTAPMPCHRESVPAPLQPLDPEPASCLDACPLCAGVWLPSVAAAEPSPSGSAIPPVLLVLDPVAVRGGEARARSGRWPPASTSKRSSVLRL
jgi:hypothetical protein